MAAVDGDVAPGYEKVLDAFKENFEIRGDVGAAFALYRDGEKVVDVWGGVADEASGRPWTEDTMQYVFSTTKGATAMCAHLLAQRGELDFDAAVSAYWPEFKQNGKERIPVRWLLSHRAGLPVVDADLSPAQFYDWDPIIEALEAQRPIWEPGTAHGYHGITYGYLVGELIRRITGRTVGRFLADEITGPLGAEFHIGLPTELEPLVSTTIVMQLGPTPEQREMLKGLDLDTLPDEFRALAKAFLDPDSLSVRALNLGGLVDDVNSPVQHAAEVPAANGIGTARGIALMYAALIGEVDGVRILNPATVDAARAEQSAGPDKILIMNTRFGLGFMLDHPDVPFLGRGSFGHDGAGGSLAFADPESGIAFAYVMNKMNANINGDPRAQALIHAVRDCL